MQRIANQHTQKFFLRFSAFETLFYANLSLDGDFPVGLVAAATTASAEMPDRSLPSARYTGASTKPRDDGASTNHFNRTQFKQKLLIELAILN